MFARNAHLSVSRCHFCCLRNIVRELLGPVPHASESFVFTGSQTDGAHFSVCCCVSTVETCLCGCQGRSVEAGRPGLLPSHKSSNCLCSFRDVSCTAGSHRISIVDLSFSTRAQGRKTLTSKITTGETNIGEQLGYFSKNVFTRVKICRCTTGTSKRPGGRTRSCFVHLGGRAEIHCPHLNPLLSVFFFFSRAVYSVALLPGRFLTRCRCCAHETKTLLLPCFLMSRPASRHQRKVKADSGSFYIRQASLCRHSVGMLAFLDWL